MNHKPFRLFVSLALASLVLSACGGGLFAAPTPTPTSTNTPVPTSTPTITPSPTLTFTPTPTPEASLEQLAEGSTQFTDLKGGYRIVFPEGWLVVNLAVEDPQKAVADAQKDNPDQSALLQNFNLYAAQKARLGALDLAPGHFSPTSAPNLYIILDAASKSLSLDDILDANAKLLPLILNATVKNLGVKDNSHGVAYGVLDVTLKTLPVREQVVMFKCPGYTVLITLVLSNASSTATLASFSEILDSIVRLNR